MPSCCAYGGPKKTWHQKAYILTSFELWTQFDGVALRCHLSHPFFVCLTKIIHTFSPGFWRLVHTAEERVASNPKLSQTTKRCNAFAKTWACSIYIGKPHLTEASSRCSSNEFKGHLWERSVKNISKWRAWTHIEHFLTGPCSFFQWFWKYRENRRLKQPISDPNPQTFKRTHLSCIENWWKNCCEEFTTKKKEHLL